MTAKIRLLKEEREKRQRLIDNVASTLLANATGVETDYLTRLGARLLTEGSLEGINYLAVPEDKAKRTLLSYSLRHLQVALEQEQRKKDKP